MYFDKEQIAQIITDFFQELFHGEAVEDVDQPVEDVDQVVLVVEGKVTLKIRQILDLMFTRKEVKQALFQMHPLKATAPDDMQAIFY